MYRIKIRKILLLFFLIFMFVGIGCYFFVQSPYFQNILVDRISKKIQESKGVFFTVDHVKIDGESALFGGFLTKDHHNDTLVYIKEVEAKMDLFSIIFGDFEFQKLTLTNPDVRIKVYENEDYDNLNIYLKKLKEESTDEESKPFFVSGEVLISDGRFFYLDENKEVGFQKVFTSNQINFSSPLFEYDDGEIRSKIHQLSFYEPIKDIKVNEFIGKLTINKSGILFNDLNLKTGNSAIKADYLNLKMKNESWKDFNSFVDSIRLEVNILPSELDLREFSAFIPSIDYKDSIRVESEFSGTVSDLAVDHIKLYSSQATRIDGNFRLKLSKNQFYIQGKFDELQSHFDEYKKWIPIKSIRQIPKYFIRLEQINYKGSVYLTDKEVLFDGFLKSSLGNVLLNVSLYDYGSVSDVIYDGFFLSKQFDLGKFLNDPFFGKTSFDVGLDGTGLSKEYFDSHITGTIDYFDLYDYRYKNIEAKGTLKDRIFEGRLVVNDENASFDMKGKIDMSEEAFKVDYVADITSLSLPHLNLYSLDSISKLSGEVEMNLTGTSLDDIKGKVNVYGMTLSTSKNYYFFQNLEIESMIDKENQRVIYVDSPDLIKGKLKGDFYLSEMFSLFKNSTKKLFPIEVTSLSRENQYYSFDFRVFNTAIEAFLPNVKIEAETKLKGRVDGKNDHLDMYFSSPRFHYKDNVFLNLDISLDTRLNEKTHVKFDRAKIQGIKIDDFLTQVSFLPKGLGLKSKFTIKNKNTHEFDLDLSQSIDEQNRLVLNFNRSTIKYNNKYWVINQNRNSKTHLIFDFDENHYALQPIELSLSQSKLVLSGEYKGDDYRRLKADFNHVDVSNIYTGLDDIRLQGIADGSLDLELVDGKLNPDLNLLIDGFAVNDILLGLFNGKVSRKENQDFYSILGKVEKEDKNTFLAEGKLIDNKEKGRKFDLDINLDDFEPSVLNGLLVDIIEMNGKMSGSIYVQGLVDDPDFTGEITFNDFELFVPYTNVKYKFATPLVSKISKNNFEIPEIAFFDKRYKTKGTVRGKIYHRLFDKWILNLNVNTDNILALDTNENDNSDYYGRVFAEGNAHFVGPVENLKINIKAKTKPNTFFYIPIGGVREAGNNDFIRFLPPRKPKNPLDFFEENPSTALAEDNNLQVNISLEATEEAQTEILFDPRLGHSLRSRGKGVLEIDVDSYGKFDLFGSYIISDGNYFFNFANFVTKKFSVVGDGVITWAGDPYNAVLDVEAMYNTKVSNIGEYLENESYSGNTDVQLKIHLTENLYTPSIELGVYLPRSSESVRSALSYAMANQDQENRQFLSIITTRKFLSERNNVGESGLANTVFEILSNQISNIASNISEQVDVGIQYIQGSPLDNTSDEIDLSLTTQLSDRLTVQGNVGVPVGSGYQTSQFVGEFDILYRLNKQGTVQLKAFNRKDEIENLSTEINGYRQGIGIQYSKDFNSFRELKESILKKKDEKEKIEKDSLELNKFVRFKGTSKN